MAREPGDFEALVQAGSSARHAGDAKAAAGLFDRVLRISRHLFWIWVKPPKARRAARREGMADF